MMATLLFYILGAITVIATLLAIIQRNPVHAVIYLVNSFFALASAGSMYFISRSCSVTSMP